MDRNQMITINCRSSSFFIALLKIFVSQLCCCFIDIITIFLTLTKKVFPPKYRLKRKSLMIFDKCYANRFVFTLTTSLGSKTGELPVFSFIYLCGVEGLLYYYVVSLCCLNNQDYSAVLHLGGLMLFVPCSLFYFKEGFYMRLAETFSLHNDTALNWAKFNS